MSERGKISVRKVLWNVMVLGGAALGIVVAVVAFAEIFRISTTVYDVRLEFNPKTNAVVVRNVYGDDHTKVVAKYTESSEQETNPLRDPLYAGDAAEATGYNPREIYESDLAWCGFEYNLGARYGECGQMTRNEETGIMTVEFNNGVTSWVDKKGVIASAWIKYGYDFDDSEVYVAFYRDV